MRKPEFHPSVYGKASSVLAITGKRSFDRRLMLNMCRMFFLEQQINALRNSAKKIRNLDQTKAVVDNARELETKFNRLKEANFLIFLEAFGEKKG